MAFDLPTQIGYDADDEMAEGEVGKVGVSICSIEDMETLFQDIPLEKVTTSMTINATASILLALYVAVAKKQGADLLEAGRHDPERHPQGVHRPRHVHLPAAAVDAADHGHVRLVQREPAEVEHDQHLRLPHARGRLHRRAGGGFTIADAIEYAQAALDAG